ncbi:hypothetical protein SSX86_032617 [Deinandra increscens subsp. villosa]|uniref:TF-B3 domain-containing protein n=1 Tax=Deinandra increscens subsp. villosa TaxID=3103831 RepID=A0AAP0GHK9_9ASTR
MAKITKKIKAAERRGSRGKFPKTSSEAICREKIAMLLCLLDFHDDPTCTTETMLRRLRQIEERNPKHSSATTVIRKITFKFDGKKYVNQAAPPDASDNLDSENPKMISYDGKESDQKSFQQQAKKKKISGNDQDGDHIVTENPSCSDDIMKFGDFIKSIGGSEIELVIRKTLTKSDCDKGLGRLLIPAIQVKNPGFLAVDEKRRLEMKECISVDVFDPQRRKWTLNLAQWNMKNGNYALRTKWKNIVRENGFKENTVIRVFSFRVQQKLCFVVVRD